MIVKPGILRHPKYQALRERFGDVALTYLVAIWEHCELVKGANWGPVSAKYVEKVAGYRGKRGELFRMMVDPMEDGSTGWIELVPAHPEFPLNGGESPENSVESPENSAVLVHDWAEVNSRLLQARDAAARGGRAKALMEKARRSSAAMTGAEREYGGSMANGLPPLYKGEEGNGSNGSKGEEGAPLSDLNGSGKNFIENGRKWLRANGVPEEFISWKEKFLNSPSGWTRVLSWWEEKRGGKSEVARRSRDDLQTEKDRIEGELATKGAVLSAEEAKGLQAELAMIRKQLGE